MSENSGKYSIIMQLFDLSQADFFFGHTGIIKVQISMCINAVCSAYVWNVYLPLLLNQNFKISADQAGCHVHGDSQKCWPGSNKQ